MTRQVPVLVAGLVVIGLLLAVALVLPAGAGAEEPTPSPPADDPAVSVTIELTERGDAHWSIDYRFALETAEDEEAFDRLAAAVAAGEVELPLTTATMAAYRDASASITDREMAIEDAGWSTETDDGAGTLSLELTWTNFAQPRGETLEIGSAFRGPDGLWLQTLGDGMELTIVGPDDHPLAGEPPADAVAAGNTVTWTGPHSFTRDELALQYEVPPTGLSLAELFGLVVLLLAVIIALIAVAYRSGAWSLMGATEDEAAAATAGAPAVDVELLSDPERVEHLLESNGGRMKQAAIVEETGWSSAKVSQLLSEMAEDDRVEKLRIGQENLISLPPSEPDEASES